LNSLSTLLTKVFCVTSHWSDIREAINDGEIIEDYPDDKYGPSCLILGYTQAGRALHIQCSYPSRPLVKFITLYEPDKNLWIDFKVWI
jgi:hypothetical protein